MIEETKKKAVEMYVEKKKVGNYESALFWLEVYVIAKMYEESKDENILKMLAKKLRERVNKLLNENF